MSRKPHFVLPGVPQHVHHSCESPAPAVLVHPCTSFNVKRF